MFDKLKTGLAFGVIAAVWHFVWIILVGLGIANAWMTWVLELHFLNNPFTLQPFNYATAILLVIVAFILGFIVGWVFALFWNWAHKK